MLYSVYEAYRNPDLPDLEVCFLTQFEALGLSPKILKSVQSLGFTAPTPIQSEAIPLILGGKDIMGLAQTGTGKTAAFGLPLVQYLLAENTKLAPRSVRALILAPTRELAKQIADNLRAYSRQTPLRIELVVGGVSIGAQVKKLARGTDIVVATPGRLIDLLERKAVFLETAKFLVLDEADQMLDLGFIHTLRRISKLLGRPRQTLLFSATMPKQIEELSRTYQINPVRVEVSPPGQAAEKVRQSVHFTGDRSKVELLKQCLAERPDDLSLVFARTKHGAEKLMKSLVQSGFSSASIHGNKNQNQRERAIKAFRDGRIRILVATDVAARGIDIPGVSHVYNFDLPEVPENYVHRIGRTARAGANGDAVAFCAPADLRLLRDIERLIGAKILVASGEPAKAKSVQTGKTFVQKGRRRRNSQNGYRAASDTRTAENNGASRRGPAKAPKKAGTTLRPHGAGVSQSRGNNWRGAKQRLSQIELNQGL